MKVCPEIWDLLLFLLCSPTNIWHVRALYVADSIIIYWVRRRERKCQKSVFILLFLPLLVGDGCMNNTPDKWLGPGAMTDRWFSFITKQPWSGFAVSWKLKYSVNHNLLDHGASPVDGASCSFVATKLVCLFSFLAGCMKRIKLCLTALEPFLNWYQQLLPCARSHCSLGNTDNPEQRTNHQSINLINKLNRSCRLRCTVYRTLTAKKGNRSLMQVLKYENSFQFPESGLSVTHYTKPECKILNWCYREDWSVHVDFKSPLQSNTGEEGWTACFCCSVSNEVSNEELSAARETRDLETVWRHGRHTHTHRHAHLHPIYIQTRPLGDA